MIPLVIMPYMGALVTLALVIGPNGTVGLAVGISTPQQKASA